MRERRVRTLGQRYELATEIAAGGMASVHLARQIGAVGWSRIVAVKRLHERFARDPDFVAMFLDEARLVARIRHPNVVQTIDVVAEASPEGAGAGELFIVMEYVHGESLARLAKAAQRSGEPIPARIAAAIVSAALHGLHEAHEARSEDGTPLGIVHRDVSPQNILVGVDGIARVLDFGVAKATARITTTHEGQLKGKLSYMSPEQVTAGEVDRRTDVYAAAVVLWELFAGTKLHQGPSEGAVVQKILSSTVPTPSGTNANVSPGLDAIVMRGLARDPAERFATAREMAIAIEQEIGAVTTAEIGEWVRTTCAASLEAKAALIASIEAKASSGNLREAVESLRAIGARRDDDASTLAAPSSRSAEGIPPPQSAQRSLFPSGSVGSVGGLYLSSAPPRLPSIAPSARPTRATTALVATAGMIGVLAFVLGVALYLRARNRHDATAVVVDASSAPAALASGAPAPRSCPPGMVLVPGGRFFMGSDEGPTAEKPAHKVSLRAFCIDRHEVTTDAYRACSDRGDCKRAGQANRWDGISPKEQKTYDPLCNASAAGRGNHPINCVDWSMAEGHCRAEGKRLPTEAEWEFAARGSDGRKYPWGDVAPTSKHLNACGRECIRWLDKARTPHEGVLYTDDDGWPTTAPVGSFPLGASTWGVEDVAGNVWEWVADRYGPYTAAEQVDPGGPEVGSTRVIRGGAWNGASPDWVRPTFRHQSSPDTRSHGIGFRCAISL